MTERALSPYAQAVDEYLHADWQGVIPLPANSKWPPPNGYTGHEGTWPTGAQIDKWRTSYQAGDPPSIIPTGNIALRLPANVIGIDIDLYRDADARHVLEELTGELPPTWCCTSRIDGSGVRLYAIPPPPQGKRWKTVPVPAVEVIQRHHRYVVAPPSIHPEGRAYFWVDERTGELPERPPTWDELTPLPWRAASALLEDTDAGKQRDAVPVTLTDGAITAVVRRRLEAALTDVASRPGGRHDATRDHVLALVRYAERGEHGVRQAIDVLRGAFVNAVAPDRHPDARLGRQKAEREFDDLVASAADLVARTEPLIPTHEEREKERAEYEAALQQMLGVGNVKVLNVATPNAEAEADDESPAQAAHDALHLIDWSTFWDADATGEDWLCEPLIARGRGHALYAGAKSGKSLLMLAACAAIATGRPFLRKPAGRAEAVLYLDYEMTPDDLRDRLEGFGYGPDDDLSLLHYSSLPSVDPLDTLTGAQAIVNAAARLQVAHVVIDTTSRAISGEENSADTFRALYRLLGLQLKARQIGYHRLDHSGKDLERGQRGSSAKNDDVDVVQQLVPRDKGAMTIRATHRRMAWVPESFDVTRADEAGVTIYSTEQRAEPTGTYHLVKWLDEHDVPVSLSKRKVIALLREHGEGRRDDAVAAAQRIRRQRENDPKKWFPTIAEPLSPSGSHDAADTIGNHPQKSRSETRNHFGNHREPPSQRSGSRVPPYRGNRYHATPEPGIQNDDTAIDETGLL